MSLLRHRVLWSRDEISRNRLQATTVRTPVLRSRLFFRLPPFVPFSTIYIIAFSLPPLSVDRFQNERQNSSHPTHCGFQTIRPGHLSPGMRPHDLNSKLNPSCTSKSTVRNYEFENPIPLRAFGRPLGSKRPSEIRSKTKTFSQPF